MSYTYTPLSQAGREIRCVTICPGTWNDVIECDLQIVPLNDSPQYEALSYFWGDPSKTRNITIEGRSFQITENLYFALRRLRLESSPRIMWIDAICINQKDDDEKSVQVAMMGRIYANCRKAVMWLGEDPLLISTTHPPLPPPPLNAKNAFKLCWILGREDRMEANLKWLEALRESLARDNFIGLPPFLAPWWYRIWVVQEMALPREIEFAYASEICPYSVLYEFYQYYNTTLCHNIECWISIHGIFRCPKVAIDRLDPLIRTREFIREKDKISLSDLTTNIATSAATDPRDLIYGLLGMVTDWGTIDPLVPDYKLSLHKVMCDAAFKIIQQNRSLRILRVDRWSFSYSLLEEIWGRDGPPSWMRDLVNFHSGHAIRNPYLTIPELSYSVFNASKDIYPMADLIYNTILRTRSIKVDVIKYAVEIPLSHSFQPIRQIMGKCDIRGWPHDPPAETTVEAYFWRAVMYGVIKSGSRTTVEDGLLATSELANNLEPTLGLRRLTLDDYQSVRSALSAIEPGGRPSPTDPDLTEYVGGCAMFLTASGKVGVGPPQCKQDDEIHVVPGSAVPLILRPVSTQTRKTFNKKNHRATKGTHIPREPSIMIIQGSRHREIGSRISPYDGYEVIGDGYMHGIMDGEALQGVNMNAVPIVELL
ncbi:HET-domain-containing protein [Rostrohypoxylon terebratum]|nr:HET-domain-containing protein [Rostrohypoxylon terebratum]